MNRWLDDINPDGTEGPMEWEINNNCMFCGKGIRSWFHGQGAVCNECYRKGKEVPSILKIFDLSKPTS